MLQIVKSILGSTDEGKYSIVSEILSTIEKDLAPNELAVFQFLKQGYDDLHQFQTEDIFLRKFPEYRLTLKDLEPLKDNSVKEKDSLDYYKREFILKHQKNAISKKLLFMANTIQQTGLTPDMVESLRNDIIEAKEEEDILKMPDAREIYEKNKEVCNKGIKTYIPEIDQLIGAINPGTISVIAGYTGHGKTTWAVNMAYKGARDGKNVVYISLEVALSDLLFEMISLHSTDINLGTPPLRFDDMRRGKLTESQIEVYNKVVEDFNQKVLPNIHILTESTFKQFSYGEVRDILYRIDAEKPIDVLFVDHANLLKFYVQGKFNSTTDAGNEFVSFFRKMAICFKKDGDGKGRPLTVILLAQCNRSGWVRAANMGKKDRKDKDKNENNPNLEGMYDNTALAEINELERAASYIFFTYTSDSMKFSKEARITFTKNRFGQTLGTPIPIYFNPEFYQYGEQWDHSGPKMNDYSSLSSFDDFMDIDPTSMGFNVGTIDTSGL